MIAEALLSISEVSARTGLTIGTLQKYVSDGRFPKPEPRPNEPNAWPESVVSAWSATRPKRGLGLTQSEVLILQALRAGPMTVEQLYSRNQNANHALSHLRNRGYVISSGAGSDTVHELTAAGRAACPPRNPASVKVRRAA